MTQRIEARINHMSITHSNREDGDFQNNYIFHKGKFENEDICSVGSK